MSCCGLLNSSCGCNRNCGCQCGCARRCCHRQEDDFITLSGIVFGTDGRVEGIRINYTIDGVEHRVFTNENGRYTIVVKRGSHVRIWVQTQLGVEAVPERYILVAVENRRNLDFELIPVVG